MIAQVFAEAVERPTAERALFLDAACGDQPVVRAEVESLLAAHHRAERLLDPPEAEWVVAALAEVGQPAGTGERFGPYRVQRELGHGGMGAVYLAERVDGQFEQSVALKLVRDPSGSGNLVERFLRERRILARLTHPNIARLLDGGVADDGRPFLAMEYVDGTPIIAYCDQRRLGIDARLRLFLDACEAVAYAHRSLVVHRDLKPSNILVSDDGRVKLLDFGIAKLLEPDTDVDTPTLTVAGFQMLTPEYAAPEQVRGESVTTATDVYGLGAVLYELLSGYRPHHFQDRTLAGVERVLSGTTPEPPSTTTTRGDAGESVGGSAGSRTHAAVAAARDVTPQQLRRRLAGDLDAIVLTALRYEPERRYASAEALAGDLRRHLARRPVTARRDSALYRFRRFVRRNRVGVAASSVAVAAMVAGLIGTTWQARAASRHALRADRVRQFVVGLFEAADPDRSRGDTITARGLLDRGTERLESELEAEPAVRADMLGVLGKIYQKLGLYDQARPLLEEARKVREELAGPRDLETAQSTADLASLLYDQGEYAAAEELARAVLRVRGELLGPGDTLVAVGMASLAAILDQEGALAAADSLYRESLAINRRRGSRSAIAGSLSDLGVALWREGKYAEAEPLAEEALALRREIYGGDHTEVAVSLLNLATILTDAGEYERAEPLLRECLAMRRKLLGDRHPDVALTLNNLGRLLQLEGRLEESEQANREALAIRRAALGDDHPEVAASLNNLGVVLYMRRNWRGAADAFEQALAVWRKTLGETHPSVLTGLNNLGAARREQGDLEGAERALREALAQRRKALGAEHPDVGQSFNNLAELLARKGDYEDAEAMFRRALTTWRSSLGVDHPTVAVGLVGLGRMMRSRGRCAEAEPLLREALAIREKKLDPAGVPVASVRLELGSCLVASGHLAEAEPLLRASYATFLDARGEADEETQRAQRMLAQASAARPDQGGVRR